jgi:tetratricopeptide (TPR) repeat protein
MRHGRIGDLLKTSGDLAGALREYQTKEALVEALAKSQPKNTEWQADIAETNKKIGDTLVAQENRAAALTAYKAALAIRETLAKANANDAAAQIELVLANWVLAAQGDDPAGRLAFIDATLRKLNDARQLTGSQTQWLPMAENQLSTLQQN